MRTTVGINSAQAVKRWSAELAIQTSANAYFTKFEGDGKNSIIQRKSDLTQGAGDEIRFDLRMGLRGDVTEGDNVIEGNEENLTFKQDKVRIDQVRKAADSGGRMSKQRTLFDLRTEAKNAVAEYLAEWTDEMKFVYLSGTAPGTYMNQDAKFKREFADNPVEAPDLAHLAYGGTATSKATLEATHIMTRSTVERINVMPEMMQATDSTGNTVTMQPVSIEGGKYFVLLMSPFQAHDLRNEKGELSWADVQKAAAGAEGSKNALFKGNLGMIGEAVLHKHKSVRRFKNYGAGSNVEAHRALYMGSQAGVLAYGNGNGKSGRYSWVEKPHDAENSIAIYGGCIQGFKKTRFEGTDFGVIAVDTASKSPNPTLS